MSYLNVVEVEAAISNLAAAFQATARAIALPHRTAEGRTSQALCVGAGAPGTRDSVIIIGGQHGREWGSCEIALNFATDLLGAHAQQVGLAYGGTVFSAAQVQGLVDGLHIVVFPLVNPDGRHHSQAIDGMWRKNRRPGVSPSNPACVGVDVNRNFDFLFDFRRAFAPTSPVSVSDDPCDDAVYQGPAPFSEPESRNVLALFEQFPRTRCLVDLHSHGQVVQHVWGVDEAQDGDPSMNFMNAAFDRQRGLAGDAYSEFMPAADQTIARRLCARFAADVQAVRGTTYAPMAAFEYCPTAGASHDYAYARHRVDPSLARTLGIVVEWGLEFQPDWSEMEEIVKEVSAGLIGLCLDAS